jgi:hypothetical protein
VLKEGRNKERNIERCYKSRIKSKRTKHANKLNLGKKCMNIGEKMLEMKQRKHVRNIQREVTEMKISKY